MDTTMARIALITASTASLPPQIISRYNIHIIPFTVQFVDGNYRDDGTMTQTEFYARLQRAEVVPTTAPMSVAHFIQYFEREHLDAEALIVFHGTPQTSKGYENAVQAAARVPQRRIININTRSFSMGIGLQIIAAAHAIHNGASVDDVVTLMDALAPRTLALFSPESVRYLRMSGRVGRVPALAASLLGIHPLLGLGSDGAMEVLARPRSAEAARTMIPGTNPAVCGYEARSRLGRGACQCPRSGGADAGHGRRNLPRCADLCQRCWPNSGSSRWPWHLGAGCVAR